MVLLASDTDIGTLRMLSAPANREGGGDRTCCSNIWIHFLPANLTDVIFEGKDVNGKEEDQENGGKFGSKLPNLPC